MAKKSPPPKKSKWATVGSLGKIALFGSAVGAGAVLAGYIPGCVNQTKDAVKGITSSISHSRPVERKADRASGYSIKSLEALPGERQEFKGSIEGWDVTYIEGTEPNSDGHIVNLLRAHKNGETMDLYDIVGSTPIDEAGRFGDFDSSIEKFVRTIGGETKTTYVHEGHGKDSRARKVRELFRNANRMYNVGREQIYDSMNADW